LVSKVGGGLHWGGLGLQKRSHLHQPQKSERCKAEGFVQPIHEPANREGKQVRDLGRKRWQKGERLAPRKKTKYDRKKTNGGS